MTENKRYFKREWEEEYYIFDSTEISEEKVDEEIEYGYDIFANSMQGDEVVNKLNEQEETIQELLKYKYLVKALEEVSKGDIGEIIYDYAGEGYEDEKSQLELGKICSENGLEWWR